MAQTTCTPDEKRLNQQMVALRDAIELLSGKWKFGILLALHVHGALRFSALQERSAGISPKVLAEELQDLVANRLITRTINNTKPITVTYAITEHAFAAEPAILALIEFGLKHRQKIMSE
ncbi:winged helix-turn-helix transcriptional regulator [Spirosoma radiotolerans]|uniref:HxlR family transcriptional regulator n=1 Tax=Spirosoma radiotolerans TaxID=1379870 RepID=A0A0E3V9H6_9BACT|nr:helix-turn-helix domain-containing protein [Spirosoma radiotolerans]AKD57151.1 HxlR family transcriptional regulator [Spirosoma radiotolerans]